MTDDWRPGGYPLSRTGRVLLATWSACLLGVFAVAISLAPDPRGYGTHESIGLPACSFRMIFNRPCPSCGMTTSFSNFVRGQWRESARANVGGLFLAVVCAVAIPWCMASVYTARLWWVWRPDVFLVWSMTVMCGVMLAQWVIRLSR